MIIERRGGRRRDTEKNGKSSRNEDQPKVKRKMSCSCTYIERDNHIIISSSMPGSPVGGRAVLVLMPIPDMFDALEEPCE